jgi:hypothetical protein
MFAQLMDAAGPHYNNTDFQLNISLTFYTLTKQIYTSVFQNQTREKIIIHET